MKSAQVPTAAKIKYLEGALKALYEVMQGQRADSEIVRVWQYQIEIVEAIIADYKQKVKNDPAR